MIDTKITVKYILTAVTAVILTWVIHEFAHWITYRFLGYDAIMTLNTVSVSGNETLTDIQSNIASAAGPLITVLQGLAVYYTLKFKTWNKYLYPFLLSAFYMRFVAGIVNIVNPNDEGRISEYLGIGLFTISIIVSGFLFYLVYRVSKKHHLNWKFQLATVITIMTISSMIIVLDNYFKIQLL